MTGGSDKRGARPNVRNLRERKTVLDSRSARLRCNGFELVGEAQQDGSA